jgi:hypothetical protein
MVTDFGWYDLLFMLAAMFVVSLLADWWESMERRRSK